MVEGSRRVYELLNELGAEDDRHVKRLVQELGLMRGVSAVARLSTDTDSDDSDKQSSKGGGGCAVECGRCSVRGGR